MPARPLSDQSLQLIHALRESLEQALGGIDQLEERTLFGSYCFFVDGKLCLGVKHEELLVRLPPARHSEFLEMQGLRELSPGGGMQGYFWISSDGYASREHWSFWLREALAYNPQAKASPRRKKDSAIEKDSSQRKSSKRKSSKTLEVADAAETPKKHPIFDSD